MSFNNVEVKKQANIYHDGKVTSRTIITADGKRKTLGVALPGTYQFETEEAETIDITQGHCRVKIADEQDWREYQAGESLSIPAHTQFGVEVLELVDYVCHFS